MKGRTFLYGTAFDGKTPTTVCEETFLQWGRVWDVPLTPPRRRSATAV